MLVTDLGLILKSHWQWRGHRYLLCSFASAQEDQHWSWPHAENRGIHTSTGPGQGWQVDQGPEQGRGWGKREREPAKSQPQLGSRGRRDAGEGSPPVGGLRRTNTPAAHPPASMREPAVRGGGEGSRRGAVRAGWMRGPLLPPQLAVAGKVDSPSDGKLLGAWERQTAFFCWLTVSWLIVNVGFCHNDFPGGSGSKASAYKAGDLGSIPRSTRSPGEGNNNPLQYSCLENPMDGGAW